MLYTFQAVPPPIIRSSKLYIQHRVLCQIFFATCHCRGRDGTPSYSFRASDDGRRNRLKHVEHFTEINNLRNVASCWLYLKISCITVHLFKMKYTGFYMSLKASNNIFTFYQKVFFFNLRNKNFVIYSRFRAS